MLDSQTGPPKGDVWRPSGFAVCSCRLSGSAAFAGEACGTRPRRIRNTSSADDDDTLLITCVPSVWLCAGARLEGLPRLVDVPQRANAEDDACKRCYKLPAADMISGMQPDTTSAGPVPPHLGMAGSSEHRDRVRHVHWAGRE